MQTLPANKKKLIKLEPFNEPVDDYSTIEQEIIDAFRREVFLPILSHLKQYGVKKKVLNSIDDLAFAIAQGKIFFKDGQFFGSFDASISKELKNLGAHWNRKNKTWGIDEKILPHVVRSSISMSSVRWDEKLKQIDDFIKQNIYPDVLAENLSLSSSFDKAIWKVEKQFRANVKKIGVQPEFTPAIKENIAKEWSENLKKDIKGWTDEQLLLFRKDLRKMAFTGQRYESLVKLIQARYNVSKNKAKFWARQETSLAMASYQYGRYQDAGVDWYCWRTVHDDKVRHSHKELDGRAFQFSRPPVTTGPGEKTRRNNPKQDFNCRCQAIPLVNFEGKWGDKVK